MTAALKKLLDNTGERRYNILVDSEGVLTFPPEFPSGYDFIGRERNLETTAIFNNTFFPAYKKFKRTWEDNKHLFTAPPVFSGSIFACVVFMQAPRDIDIFFNSHGLTPQEAEDSLCLFLEKLGVSYTERDYSDYRPSQTFEEVFRVFDLAPILPERQEVNHLTVGCQAILKDMGPPEDNPLYVTRDFSYNHAMTAMSLEGDPVVHFAGPAVFGFENECHVQYGPRGFEKALRLKKNFATLDLYTPPPKEKLEEALKVKNTTTTLRKRHLEQLRKSVEARTGVQEL